MLKNRDAARRPRTGRRRGEREKASAHLDAGGLRREAERRREDAEEPDHRANHHHLPLHLPPHLPLHSTTNQPTTDPSPPPRLAPSSSSSGLVAAAAAARLQLQAKQRGIGDRRGENQAVRPDGGGGRKRKKFLARLFLILGLRLSRPLPLRVPSLLLGKPGHATARWVQESTWAHASAAFTWGRPRVLGCHVCRFEAPQEVGTVHSRSVLPG